MKIFIDPGHGGNDPGACGNGLKEKDITLAIALRVRDILVKEYVHISVKLSRTHDKMVSLRERTNDANRWGADFYMSIHINAGGGGGYEDFIFNTLSDVSYVAGIRDIIHTEIMKVSSLPNRGKKKANFHVLRESNMPAVLTENGFIDNFLDAEKMKEQKWLDQISRGHALGLAKSLCLEKRINKISIRYLEVITDSLWTYHTAKWTDRAVKVNRGDIFTIIKDSFLVDGGLMYQIKSGLYITASSKYVRAYQKNIK